MKTILPILWLHKNTLDYFFFPSPAPMYAFTFIEHILLIQ